MAKTIEQLWYGNLRPVRHLGCNREDIKRLEYLMQRNVNRLSEQLTESGKEILEKYDDCSNEYCSLLAEQAFSDGFCLGVKILMEAGGGAEYLIR